MAKNKWAAGNYNNSGLSKAQYLAKQSAPKKTVAKAPAPLKGAGPLLPGQTRQSEFAGPSLPGQVQGGYYNYENNSVEPSSTKSTSSSNKSSNSNKSSSSSNRETASKIFNSVAGIKTANASDGGTISQGKSSTLGNIVNEISRYFQGTGAGNTYNYLAGLFRDKPQQTAPYQDQPTGYGANGEKYYNNYNPATDGAMILRSDIATPGTDFARPGSEMDWMNGGNPMVYGAEARKTQENYGSSPIPTKKQNNQPTSNNTYNRPKNTTPVSNPYQIPTQPQGTDLSSIIKQLIEYRPDNTPSQNTNGTVQRPVGMGQFSSGQYGNGAGGYGFQGSLGGSLGGSPAGTDGNNPVDESLINDILGIKTASASGFDMAPNPYQTNSLAGLQSSMNNITPSATYMGERPTYTGGSNGMGGDLPQQRTPQTKKGGGVVQQYAQGSPESLLQGQMKGFGVQEKAQKKALDELIKSIKNQYSKQGEDITNQYNTQQTQGTSALDQAKQQDLLKLSGLFNFGANQDPNSEQRIQYEGRTNNDYAGQLKDFLAKLVQSRTTDMGNLDSQQNQAISQAKQGYQQQLSSLADKRNSTQMQLAQMVQAAQQKALNSSAKGGGPTSAGSVVYVGNNAQGEPVYRNSKTGAMQTMTGLTKNNDLMSLLAGIAGQGNQQGGSWETDPDTGEKIWVTDK